MTDSKRQATSGLSEEAELLRQFLRWAEIVILFLGAVLGVLYAIFRSPMSLVLALLAFLVIFPGLHYTRAQVLRNRTQFAVLFSASLIWMVSLSLSLIGFRVFAASAMVAVLSVVLALPYSTPMVLRRVMVGAALVCALGALLAMFGPVVTSTLPAETSQMVVVTFVPLLLGLCLISLWHSGTRLRRSGDEMRRANLRLAESERMLEQRVEQRTEELDQKVAEVSDINEVARTVNATLDPRLVMQAVMNSLQKVFRFDGMGLALLDDEGRNLVVSLPMGEGFSEAQLSALQGREIPIPMEEDASAFVTSVKKRREIYLPQIGPEIVKMMSPSDRGIYKILPLKSLLICPLEIQDRAIGCVVVGNSKEFFDLSESEIETIKRYFTPVATAIKNARLFHEVEQRTADLDQKVAEISDINEVGRLVNSTLDLRLVMQTVMSSLQKLFSFDQMVLALLNESRDHLLVKQPMGAGFTEDVLETLRGVEIPMAEEASAFVHSVQRQRPVLLTSITPEMAELMSPSDRIFYDLNPPEGLFICPLEIQDEVIGLMFFGNTQAPLELSEEQIETFKRYVTPVATAVKNARLFNEVEQRTTALDQKVAEISDINEVARTVNSTLDPRLVVQAVMNSLQKLFHFDLMALGLLDDEGQNLVVRLPMGPGFSEDRLAALLDREIPISMDEEGSAFVASIKRRKTLYFPQITPELVEMMSPSDRSIYKLSPLKGLIICPLEISDRAIGCMVIGDTKEPFDLGEGEIETIKRYVTPVATAINNAQIFRDAKIAHAAAEEASQAKSKFLASMSHELRTPLNAIIGYSEMLREEAVDEGNEGSVPDLDKILNSGRYLLTLINSVLDLAKIEAGKMEVYLEDCDLAEVVRGVEGTVKPLVQKNANRLAVGPLEGLGAMHCDVTKLRQMLFNLLSNASKFTKNGTINLDVTRESGKEGDWLHFRIADTGIGMNAEQLGKVFEEFGQAEASTTKEYGGTGLGLPITKKFCEMLGGRIDVKSEPGQGSCFDLHLPARAPSPTAGKVSEAPPASTTATASPLDRATVLVIDDDATALDLIGRFLTGEGYRVITAPGGEEGLRLASEHHPDVITLDILMPHMDGWTVLGRLKADPALADIPVIVVTMTDDRTMGYALGAAEFLSKPIERERLGEVLRKYAPDRSDATALVVDDEPSAREMMRRGVEGAGWKVVEAENGRVALERVAEAVPDLILLDLLMPEMDGFECMDRLREKEAWREIPVLVVTAKEVTAEDRRRLEGGVVRILEKGRHTQEELLAEVRNLVGSRTSPNPEEEQTPDTVDK